MGKLTKWKNDLKEDIGKFRKGGEIREELSETKDDLSEELGSGQYNEGKKAGRRKANDNPVSITCRECTSELDTAELSRCPHCGYDTDSHKTWWWIHVIAVGILWATVVGIPFSIIPWRKMSKHSKKRKQGVAKKNWS